MRIQPCDLAGLVSLEPQVFADARGLFCETWNLRRFREAGLDVPFVQDNLSRSCRGALRGLHFQNPTVQAKLVMVLEGEVFDVAVDIRRSSSTFGRWRGVTLSGDNRRQLFVPAGFAHGFLVVSDSALVHYKCSAFYSPKDELSIRWDDPDLAIEWPLGDPLLSSKDATAPRLCDLPPDRLFP